MNFCPQCDHKVKEKHNYCSHCGQSLKDSDKNSKVVILDEGYQLKSIPKDKEYVLIEGQFGTTHRVEKGSTADRPPGM